MATSGESKEEYSVLLSHFPAGGGGGLLISPGMEREFLHFCREWHALVLALAGWVRGRERVFLDLQNLSAREADRIRPNILEKERSDDPRREFSNRRAQGRGSMGGGRGGRWWGGRGPRGHSTSYIY